MLGAQRQLQNLQSTETSLSLSLSLSLFLSLSLSLSPCLFLSLPLCPSANSVVYSHDPLLCGGSSEYTTEFDIWQREREREREREKKERKREDRLCSALTS